VIGSEKVTRVDSEKLQGMLEGREWVPTTVPSLVKPEDAVLGHVVEGTGFFQVSFSEAVYPNVVAFLRAMGVRDK
jgi:sacsin